MKKVDFVFFDAGGGHRSAATALKTVIEEQDRGWRVRLVDLQDVLDSLDIFRKVTGIRMEDVYNRMLANGWTLGSEYLLPFMHGIIRLYHPAQVRMMADFWRQDPPDLAVSVVPNFNRALLQSLRRVTQAPFATILTDFADYPPHFWIEKQEQHFICGTEKALAQTRSMGHPEHRTSLVSGMILRPSFYREYVGNRAEIGLLPGIPTGIVLFGGEGSPKMLDILKRLQDAKTTLQLIMMCGRNQRLAESLREFPSRFPVHVAGFTQEVPRYMSMADFFIGKPGPGSISEALAMKLPVIIERNAWTLPQERYNADWVTEKGVGVVLKNFSQIAGAVDTLLEPARLAQYRATAAAVLNRAVFEIPEILARLMGL